MYQLIMSILDVVILAYKYLPNSLGRWGKTFE